MIHPSMNQLPHVLLKPPLASPRTRSYQSSIDDYLDLLKAVWDIERGLVGSRGLALPHEIIAEYWELDEAERAARTSTQAAQFYESIAGRDGTAPLGLAAWAWHSPLSRHHRDPDLLRFFQNGLRFFTDSIRRDGTMATYGLNGLVWAHGWDIEGLIYGLFFCGDALDEKVRERALQRLRLSAQRFLHIETKASHGNQLAVYCLGLWLYGQLLEMPEAVEKSDALFSGLLPEVLDASGQVIEQYGPCLHYSFTCFFYAWLNLFLRGETMPDHAEAMERTAQALHWFRHRHTETLYPLAGPSSRMHHERPYQKVADLLGGCEQMSTRQPMFGAWAQKLWDGAKAQWQADRQHPDVVGHGASPLLWAILAHSGQREPSTHDREEWDAPFEKYYERITLLGRSPLKYGLVKRRYQTHYNFRDFLPFSGLQTWAYEDEPPIVHPTIFAPSTTIARGLDTARQGVSHNWAQLGAGAMAADGYFRESAAPGAPGSLLARYDRLWRVVVFTDVSTLLLEWGDHGPRRTCWTLNRIEPAEAHIGEGVVSFAGRRGRIYSTIPVPGEREVRGPLFPTRKNVEPNVTVRVLEYDCGASWAAFAFSDESFRFESGWGEDSSLASDFRFSDSAGSYRLQLSASFAHVPDHALGYDPFLLLKETVIESS
jgi:hypothetical protein